MEVTCFVKKGDARILGRGDFVAEALMKAGKDWENAIRTIDRRGGISS